ncbi:ATP-dependent DNA helicase PIF4-like [Olea europaea var. sylvestris]|uniref:ATP-dependent DNA helicase PIF4-like n=1 Tax=Olea europaea var. sylvestris TaxID=158386 RepID=UPI000C1D888C|nr:ATP-dependent DNA helicase PIF4-like [Olea europaea var. sylvestris]
MFFIDGPSGIGKTFLYRGLLTAVRSRSLVVLTTASSGVVVGLLLGGRKAHSRFTISLYIHSDSICSVSKQFALADLLRMTRLIIWDEAPTNSQAVEALNKMLRDITNIELPFGGKPLFTKIKLHQDMRALLDPPFSKYLLRIENGTENEHSCSMIRLCSSMTLDYEGDNISLHKLIDIVFPEIVNYSKKKFQV